MKVAIFDGGELDAAQRGSGRGYHEFLRVPSMSVGIYRLAPGATDTQKPHAEDEIYHVISGRALCVAGGERREVGPGSVIFIAATEPHRFEEIREELVLLVFFAPPESAP